MTKPRRKVLVVDDELQVARTLKLGLDVMAGYEVRIESRGEMALAAAREFRPDIILLDVVMPDKRGDDVLRELRGDPDLAAIPVAFLTAAERWHVAGDVEPDLWISKPVMAGDVIRQIETRLAGATPEPGGHS
jgi:two-component system, OmpR family, response regulator